MGFLRTCFIVLAVFGFFASVQLTPYKCDFESGICSFLSNDGANRANWRIGKGKIKAGDTGPTIDHTKGTSNGSYIFVDVSNASVGSVKLLTVSLTVEYCVQFFYHMYGADIGDLSIYAQSVYGSESVRYFYRERTQGDRWKQARFSVSRTANMRYKGYKVNFVARGRSYSGVWGDIALDDLELTPGKCKDTKNDAYDVCSFNDYDCGYTSTRMSSLTWEWKSIHTTSNYSSKLPSEDHTLGTSIGGYWFVGDKGYSANQINQVMLTSPLYDKPKTSLNCLHFYVYLDHEGKSMWWGGVKENFIQVFLNFPNSKDPRKWIVTKAKNTTEHATWVYVEAKAEITQQFQIQFTAGLQTPVESIAALDDVKLIAGNCPEAGFCDFEQSKCSWIDGVGDYNWIRKTPSSWSNNEIGPDEDNTLKTSNGTYIVFNTKYKKAGSTASLESEYFPPGKISYCISFYYCMTGADLGTLKVNVKQENFTEASVWTLKDEQGDAWKLGKAVMKPSLMYTKVIFQGITGKGKNAYMALDDIRIRSGETCDLTPPTADPRYEDICIKFPEICRNGGICETTLPGGYRCNCPPNFSDVRCRKGCEELMGNSECQKRGEYWTCYNSDEDKSNFTCECQTGYKIKDTKCIAKTGCEDYGGNVECENKGPFWTCKNDEKDASKYSCDCVFGYKRNGTQCFAKTGCEDYGGNVECENKGLFWTCMNDEKDVSKYRCDCASGYEKLGNKCIATTTETPTTEVQKLKCDCGYNSYGCQRNEKGAKLCSCFPGYAQLGDLCSDCHCGKNTASCFFDRNERNVCICRDGFSQRNGTCTEICRSNADCLNGGKCSSDGYGSFCKCVLPYKGDRCEINEICEHMQDTCNSIGAVCRYIHSINQGFCICPPNKIFNEDLKTCEDKFEMTSIFLVILCSATVLLLLSIVIIIILLKKFRRSRKV